MAYGPYERIGQTLGRCLGADVQHCQVHVSENLHFRGTHPKLGDLFVKVYAEVSRCRREGLVLDLLKETHHWVIPGVEEGELPSGQRWRAFPERMLRPFVLDMEQSHVAGRILAELHATPLADLDLPSTEPGWTAIEPRLAKLKHWPTPYDRGTKLAEQAGPLLASLGTRPAELFLLSGDFGARNLHVRQDDGSPVLLDFERSVLGDPHWDLGKLWDQGMCTVEQRAAFLRGYRCAGGAESFPDPAALWATRFAAALGVFPYASRVGDVAFFEHGKEKLHILAGELPDLLAVVG